MKPVSLQGMSQEDGNPATVKTILTLIFGRLEWFGMKITLAKLAFTESTSTNEILGATYGLINDDLGEKFERQ